MTNEQAQFLADWQERCEQLVGQAQERSRRLSV
jgi:hypothetical protein